MTPSRSEEDHQVTYLTRSKTVRDIVFWIKLEYSYSQLYSTSEVTGTTNEGEEEHGRTKQAT